MNSIMSLSVYTVGGAGKISDEQLFAAEKRIKMCETIIGAMSEEERSNPDLVVRTVRNLLYLRIILHIRTVRTILYRHFHFMNMMMNVSLYV